MSPPSTVAEVAQAAEQTEGVRLSDLLASLQPDARAIEDALTEILRAAADIASGEVASDLQEAEPEIAAIATCQSGHEPPEDLLRSLDEAAGRPEWAALIAVLRRILAGERGEALLMGPDPICTAIVRETLARLKQGN